MTASLEQLADGMFAADAPHGQTLALVVQHGGRTLYERYGTQPDTVFGPGEAVTADTTLYSVFRRADGTRTYLAYNA